MSAALRLYVPPEEPKPAPPAVVPGRKPVGCPREILETLRAAGHRLTGMQLTSEMSRRGFSYSDNTVRATAGTMVDLGLLTNCQQSNPRGYGLPEWSE